MSFDLPSNFTNESVSVNGLGSLFEYASYATGGFFGLGLLVVIFMISFLTMLKESAGAAFVASSFISLIFSVYFVRISLVKPSIPYVLVAMVIIGIFWAKSDRGA